jgi:predicted acylesterase/phospholipase RssA
LSVKRALILSGGGVFGAWQVGAWSVLREHMSFDVIIGASIGSLNGWAIAGGATPEQLTEMWLDAADRGALRFRFPLRPLDGIVEFSRVESFIRRLYDAFQPRQEYYAVMTDLKRLRPRLIEGSQVQWRHLAASCALLGVLPQQRIDRVLYSDGGLLGALPLWAAIPCHATEVIGLNVMPRMPWVVRTVLQSVRSVRARHSKPDRERTLVLAPPSPLGSWRDGLRFEATYVAGLIARGRADAAAALGAGTLEREPAKNISLPHCFGP